MVTPRSTATWPSSGASSPVIMRNSVVLPEPLGPTRPTFSPRCSAAEASMNRRWWPFCLEMLSRRIMGAWISEENCAALRPCRATGARQHIGVIAGLDPAIHPLRKTLARVMDTRVRPAYEGFLFLHPLPLHRLPADVAAAEAFGPVDAIHRLISAALR